MDLTLVRHGEPERGVPMDPGLSARGVEQAQRVAAHLCDERHDALYVSPLARARQTAVPIASALGLTPVVVEDLAEFGKNMPYEHFEDITASKDPRLTAYLDGDLSAWGADADEFRAVVMDAFDKIIADHRGQRVLVVGHGGVANIFFATILGLDRVGIYDPAYCSISRARVGAGRYSVVSLNECGHLT